MRLIPISAVLVLAAAAAGSSKVSISYGEARPILAAHPNDIPSELKGKSSSELEAGWPGWVARHDAGIRARLERGDEDSIVNLWIYAVVPVAPMESSPGLVTQVFFDRQQNGDTVFAYRRR